MDYFDLHSDTLTELFDRGETLKESSCHVTSETVSRFDRYAQVAAVFSKKGESDIECFRRFSATADSFKNKNGFEFVKDYEDIRRNTKEGTPSFILSVEDARLLSSDFGKFEFLLEWGVKLITPLWGGVTCIGGAFDTDEGLSPFGKKLIDKMIDCGIICDVSHASRKSTAYILDACAEAHVSPVASHSNSYSVYGHPRNLTDVEAEKIAQLGGIIGISFAVQHLSDGVATVQSILEHVSHYRKVVGDGHIAFGCDFDGIETTPLGIDDQGMMTVLYEIMCEKGFDEGFVKRIFWDNAAAFFEKTI